MQKGDDESVWGTDVGPDFSMPRTQKAGPKGWENFLNILLQTHKSFEMYVKLNSDQLEVSR